MSEATVTTYSFTAHVSLKTRIRDSLGRLWFVRTFIGDDVQRLLPAVEEQAKVFVAAVEAGKTGFSEAEMEGNARGPHWFSICGHDRNCKSVSIYLSE